MSLTFGSLFAGIGGFDLGFERAGLRCVWQCEIDPFCRRVLAKHWPDVRRHDDVRTFPDGDPEDWQADVICGGFPCQDVSLAGNRSERLSVAGGRSGLWSEYLRVVRLLRPRFVVVENVAALLDNGLSAVLSDLAAVGYDAEWDCLPAAYLGAPHHRDRLFLVAYPGGGRRDRLPQRHVIPETRLEAPSRRHVDGLALAEREPWVCEPAVGRVANGIPNRVDRLRGLGNAVVPQVAEFIGRQLMQQVRPCEA